MRRAAAPSSDRWSRSGGRVREERAQATVEAAVVFPVLLVAALMAFNVMSFGAAAARFDRVAPDIVLAHGASPVTGGDASIAPERIAQAIEEELAYAMEGHPVKVEVSPGEAGATGTTGALRFSPGLAAYRCTLRYATWPGPFSIAGIDLGAPLELVHDRTMVIDPWRPGVVM